MIRLDTWKQLYLLINGATANEAIAVIHPSYYVDNLGERSLSGMSTRDLTSQYKPNLLFALSQIGSPFILNGYNHFGWDDSERFLQRDLDFVSAGRRPDFFITTFLENEQASSPIGNVYIMGCMGDSCIENFADRALRNKFTQTVTLVTDAIVSFNGGVYDLTTGKTIEQPTCYLGLPDISLACLRKQFPGRVGICKSHGLNKIEYA